MVVESEIVREPPCFYCANYVIWPFCLAFPDGIPMEIRNGDNDHRQPIDGDHGFQFEPPTAISPIIERGGPGSGHHGHKGRPGEVGGSLPSNGGDLQIPPEDRPAVTGMCFEEAARWLVMGDGMKFGDDAKLVHGTVAGEGRLEGIRFAHSWIEIGDHVFEIERGRIFRKDDFYERGKIKDTFKYTADEARINLARYQHWGPWEPKLLEGPWKGRCLIGRGGPGSGHHGHRGRPGEVGGSLPRGAAGIHIPEGRAPIRLPPEMELSEGWRFMRKEVEGFRMMTTDEETGERVILRDMQTALDKIAEELRNLNHEEFYMYSNRGQDIYTVGTETSVVMSDRDLALMQMLDRRYEYPDPVASIHNHPPSYAGQSYPPSMSDLKLMIKYGHTELHVVVPDGRWIVLAKNREIPKDFHYDLMYWWNDYADRHLYGYFPNETRSTVGTWSWNNMLRKNKDASTAYSQFSRERIEAMGEEFSDILEVQWKPLTNQE